MTKLRLQSRPEPVVLTFLLPMCFPTLSWELTQHGFSRFFILPRKFRARCWVIRSVGLDSISSPTRRLYSVRTSVSPSVKQGNTTHCVVPGGGTVRMWQLVPVSLWPNTVPFECLLPPCACHAGELWAEALGDTMFLLTPGCNASFLKWNSWIT